MCPNWEQKLEQRANGEVEGFVGRDADIVDQAAHDAVAEQNAESANIDAIVEKRVNAAIAEIFSGNTDNAPEQ